MFEHQLVALAGPGRAAPGRIATLLLPLDIEIVDMGFTWSPVSNGWFVRLTVRTGAPHGVELVMKRLNRLVEVRRVIKVSTSSASAEVGVALGSTFDHSPGRRCAAVAPLVNLMEEKA